MHQRTLAGPIEFSGIGLHTGEQASLRVLPAPAGKGIVFRRVDLDNFELRADVASVARVAYATTLMSRGVWISTVEHLLSALYGTGIDNVYIELDNFEVPILDGSAFPYTEAIARAGIVRQRTPRQYIRITKPFVLREGDKTLGIYPSDTFTIKYDIDFPHPLIGKQSLDVQLTGMNYAQKIAPARTFVAARAIAPVAGNPPTSGERMFATPCAINSTLGLCLSLLILSDTTADMSDSIAPSIATVSAGENS